MPRQWRSNSHALVLCNQVSYRRVGVDTRRRLTQNFCHQKTSVTPFRRIKSVTSFPLLPFDVYPSMRIKRAWRDNPSRLMVIVSHRSPHRLAVNTETHLSHCIISSVCLLEPCQLLKNSVPPWTIPPSPEMSPDVLPLPQPGTALLPLPESLTV